MANQLITHVDGPDLYPIKNITKADIYIICQSLTSSFNKHYLTNEYKFEPEQDGIVFANFGEPRYKSIRLWRVWDKPESFEEWKNNHDVIIASPDKGFKAKSKITTWLKATGGAPIWTPEELIILLNVFGVSGITYKKIPKKERLSVLM